LILNGLRTQVSPIGLVHDSNEFRAVQLVRTKNTITPLACVRFPRKSGRSGVVDADEYRWAGSMLARKGMVGNAVNIIPDSAWCSSHIFELPPVPDLHAKQQLARVEVARSKKCPPAAFELGCWDLPAKGRASESMAISCQRSSLDQALDEIEQAGLRVAAVDLPELAITRTLGEVESDQGITGILHVGWGESLVVIQHEGVVVYQRRIEAGLGELHERLCTQYAFAHQTASYLVDRIHRGELCDNERPIRGMWQGFARSLAENLDVAIGYVSHAYRMADLGSIYLSGYGGSSEDLIEQVDAVLGMPVHPLVMPVLAGSGLSSPQCALFAIPYGLAARFDRQ